MNFATLKGLTIPEGVVAQITDASGRVLWVVPSGNKPAILQVKKIVSNTYGTTTYTNEEFILLSITVKAGGTVNVTYGGLTKTLNNLLTSDSAYSVWFGTYNGSSDSVATPASGELRIEGDYKAIALGSYNMAKSQTRKCHCIVFIDFGSAELVPSQAFFYDDGNMSEVLTSAIITSSVKEIGDKPFYRCANLSSVTFENTSGWYDETGAALDVSDPAHNAELLRNGAGNWYRS